MRAMDYKKMLGVILVFVVVMFVLMLTSSYAWYSFSNASTSFNASTTNEEITVTYYNGKYINTSVAIPISSSEVDTYSEKNNFSILVNKDEYVDQLVVSIGLTDVNIDSALRNSDFKYDLLYQGTSIASGNFQDATTGSDFLLSTGVTLNSVDSNDFELRLYILDSDSDQNAMMNKTFRGSLSINVVSRLKASLEKE